MPIPYEVRYVTRGKKKSREVIGLLCKTAIAQAMQRAGLVSGHAAIAVSMGDANVDWSMTSPGYESFSQPVIDSLEASSNAELRGGPAVSSPERPA